MDEKEIDKTEVKKLTAKITRISKVGDIEI